MIKDIDERRAKGIAAFKFAICSIFLIFAVLITYLKVRDYDMLSITISDVGRVYPLWFFFWGVTVSVSVLLNLFFICDELKIKASIVYLMIATCSLSFMLPTLYVGYGRFSVAIHTSGVIIFGVLGYGSLIYCMLDYSKKNKDKPTVVYVYLLMLVLAAAAAVYALTGFNGIVEIILLVGAETVMLIFNLRLILLPKRSAESRAAALRGTRN
ncbi:MAG: hypothetical protein LBQ40_00530 [Clostridiales bacterium]|nr:hypothetical protein [Clostridiales bacterium]